MATSTTSTFNISAQDLIDLSLTDIGANGVEGTPNPNLRPTSLKVLQLLLKEMDTTGVFTWKIQRRTQNLIAGQASYALSNDVSDIDKSARYTLFGATMATPVMPMTREEYMRQPDRTIQGVSYLYYVEKALDTTGIEFITLFLYPVPANTGDALEYVAVLRMLDVSSLTQTLDLPQKFLNAVRWSLSCELAYPFGCPSDRLAMCKAKRDEAMAAAIGDDTQRGDLQLVPWANSVAYGYGPWGGNSR
jgi:hypothetical protein